jgi:DNA mismatch endonuclease (patch repair protein)
VDNPTSSSQSRAEIAAEQDAAAGGKEARRVSFPDGGTATASVSLSKREDASYGASLRFKHGGRTFRRKIGEVKGETRADLLRNAWALAKERNLLVE